MNLMLHQPFSDSLKHNFLELEIILRTISAVKNTFELDSDALN